MISSKWVAVWNICCVGDNSLRASGSQTLTLETPNGLPGIPVTKDGNYTDADGQQWVCDEIDLERGKYVQRLRKISEITWSGAVSLG